MYSNMTSRLVSRYVKAHRTKNASAEDWNLPVIKEVLRATRFLTVKAVFKVPNPADILPYLQPDGKNVILSGGDDLEQIKFSISLALTDYISDRNALEVEPEWLIHGTHSRALSGTWNASSRTLAINCLARDTNGAEAAGENEWEL